MSTVDIAECRRRLEAYTVLITTDQNRAPSDLHFLMEADRLTGYLPLLLDEVEILRVEVTKFASPVRVATDPDEGEEVDKMDEKGSGREDDWAGDPIGSDAGKPDPEREPVENE